MEKLSLTNQELLDENTRLKQRIHKLEESEAKRLQVEKLLRENKRKLQPAQYVAGFGDFTWDIPTGTVTWSDRMYKLLGYNKKEILDYGKVNADIHHPDDLARVTKWLMDGVSSGNEFLPPNEYRLIRKDGQILHVQTNGQIEYSDGKATKLFGTCLDITELKQFYDALQESEEKYRIIAESASDFILLHDMNGQILYANGAVIKRIGYSYNELINMSILDIVPKDRIEQLYLNKEKREAKELSRLIFELEIVTKEGKIVPIEVVSSPFIKDGKVTALFVIARDITVRKQFEAESRLSKNLLRDVMNIVPIFVCAKNLDGKFILVNKKLTDFYGTTVDEMTGILHADICQDEDELRSMLAADREVIEGGKLKFIPEETMKNPDGNNIIIETYKIPFTALGEPAVLIASVDITERRQAVDALRKSEEKFRSYLDFAPHGVFVADERGNYVEVNSAACEITGYNNEELLSMNLKEMYPPELLKTSGDRFNKLVNEGSASGENAFIRKDGSKGFWTIDAVKLSDNRFLGFAVDITERKQAEDHKINLQAQLTQAQKMESIGRLAGGVAHDFNNMLSVILGHADMIMEDLDPTQPIYDQLEEIKEAAQRSAELTKQLLAFARKQTVTPSILDLNSTLEGMLQMLRRLIGEDIDLIWQPGNNLGMIKIDPSQIDQILVNLCVNAKDSIENIGKITIETKTAVFDEDYCSEHSDFLPGEFVILAVSDDGYGMDQETLSHIFEPFFTTKELGKGTGLGLSTIYGIVKQNNGFISVFSEPNMGSTFNIYLPQYINKTKQLRDICPAKPHVRGQETILLVEDEPAILKITAMILEKLGYTVLTANRPGEAIRIAEKYADQIQLLMTDVIMPEMNGRDLAKNLLALNPNLKRLFMSGFTADVIANQGVLHKGVNFIQKPFSMKDLADKLRSILEKEKVNQKAKK